MTEMPKGGVDGLSPRVPGNSLALTTSVAEVRHSHGNGAASPCGPRLVNPVRAKFACRSSPALIGVT